MKNNNELEEKRIWGIHTPEKNDNLFLLENTIVIGWKEIGDLSLIKKSRDDFKEKYALTYPEAKKGNVNTNSGTLFRFAYEIQIGDLIIFPSKSDRMINIGVIESDYYYNESSEYAHQRKIKWIKHIPRTAFSQGALYEIGSFITLFSIKNYANEFVAALDNNNQNEIAEEEESIIAFTADEIRDNTTDYIIKEISRQLKGYDFEELVANLLEAMGYTTKISPHGGDGGRDIIAYQGELPPRIVAQAKSQDSKIQSSLVRDLKGAMSEGDYGFFVALSDYSKEAKKYLEQHPIIRGINGVQFVKLFLEYYDKLDEKYRNMIPLEKVYIPAAKGPEEYQ